MKKIICIIFFIVIILNTNIVFAGETDEIINEQEKSLGISDFLKEAKKYTEESFEDVDINSLYKEALTGNTNLGGVAGGALKILGSEVTKTLQSLRVHINYYNYT